MRLKASLTILGCLLLAALLVYGILDIGGVSVGPVADKAERSRAVGDLKRLWYAYLDVRDDGREKGAPLLDRLRAQMLKGEAHAPPAAQPSLYVSRRLLASKTPKGIIAWAALPHGEAIVLRQDGKTEFLRDRHKAVHEDPEEFIELFPAPSPPSVPHE